jgi:dienelactone hydrolase
MDFGWGGEADILAGVRFLATRPEVDAGRIGVVGISLGGMEAIGASALDPRIASVVAEGPTRRFAGDLAWLPEARGLAGAAELALDWAQAAVTAALATAPMPPPMADAVVAAGQASFLVVTGDVADEGWTAARLAAAAPGRVTVWSTNGAHARGLYDAPEAWRRTVLGFLDRTLGDGG